MIGMPSPGSRRRWLLRGLVAVMVLLVMLGGAVAVLLAQKRFARGLLMAGIHQFVMPMDWSRAG